MSKRAWILIGVMAVFAGLIIGYLRGVPNDYVSDSSSAATSSNQFESNLGD